MLLISPAAVLAEYIIGQGLMSDPVSSGSPTWPLYISRMPDIGDVKTDCGAIYNAPGLKDGRLMIGTVIEHYGVRVVIRSRSHNDGWAKLEAITLNLDTVDNVTQVVVPDTYLIENITRTRPFDSLGAEEGTKGRELFECNFLLSMKRV